MSRFLARLLGRIPVGWLQLSHNKGRLFAAIAGVAFADLLIFMQLGFMGAMIGSIALSYQSLNADLIISGSDMNTLDDGSPLPRQRMYEALAVPGVASATPLYIAKMDWKQPDGTIRTLQTFGVDPAARSFRNEEINRQLGSITLSDQALIDEGVRNLPKGTFERLKLGEPLIFETKGRTISAVGAFRIGGGFSADGYIIVSDQTFLKLFPQRAAGAPNQILVTVEPGADVQKVAAALDAVLPDYDSKVRTVAAAIAADQAFQTTQRPIGIIFGFGVLMGVIVGVIIIYQVLSSDVADHIREYATFKAMGYPQRFFMGIVFEEAVILAIFGFIPALLLSLGLYLVLQSLVGIPFLMPVSRPFLVLLGTVGMASLSGALATRKLARANPADLFA